MYIFRKLLYHIILQFLSHIVCCPLPLSFIWGDDKVFEIFMSFYDAIVVIFYLLSVLLAIYVSLFYFFSLIIN